MMKKIGLDPVTSLFVQGWFKSVSHNRLCSLVTFLSSTKQQSFINITSSSPNRWFKWGENVWLFGVVQSSPVSYLLCLLWFILHLWMNIQGFTEVRNMKLHVFSWLAITTSVLYMWGSTCTLGFCDQLALGPPMIVFGPSMTVCPLVSRGSSLCKSTLFTFRNDPYTCVKPHQCSLAPKGVIGHFMYNISL